MLHTLARRQPAGLRELSKELRGRRDFATARPLRPVVPPPPESSEIRLAFKDRTVLGEGVIPAALQALSVNYAGCFVQFTQVKQSNALEFVADRSARADAAKVDLLQKQRLEVAWPSASSPSFLEVSQAPGVLPPDVQVLQISEVPSFFRREGLFSALLETFGYDPSIVIAEGVGMLCAKWQASYAGMGNGSTCLAYVKAPPEDFAFKRLPKAFKLEGNTVKLRANLAQSPTSGSLLRSFSSAGTGSPRLQTRGLPTGTSQATCCGGRYPLLTLTFSPELGRSGDTPPISLPLPLRRSLHTTPFSPTLPPYPTPFPPERARRRRERELGGGGRSTFCAAQERPEESGQAAKGPEGAGRERGSAGRCGEPQPSPSPQPLPSAPGPSQEGPPHPPPQAQQPPQAEKGTSRALYKGNRRHSPSRAVRSPSPLSKTL